MRIFSSGGGGAVIGKDCAISSNLDLCDKQMLKIGDNTIISSEVLFVTHDASITLFGDKTRSLFGKIEIGDNCFIGERATIMYGVKLTHNVIVASGSVVTKSFLTPNIIIGGNPAKIIGTWSDFETNSHGKGLLLSETYEAVANDDERLVKRKEYKEKN